VAIWPSANVVGHVNEVTRRRARLVLGWVTVCKYTAPLCVTSHSGQLSFLPSAGWEVSTGQGLVLYGWEGNRKSVVAPAMRHRLCGISTMWASGLRKGAEQPTLSMAPWPFTFFTLFVCRAQVVIACLTPRYVLSHHCNKEIALADLLHKPIIPVMYEQIPWPPNGAMSLIFAQLVYVNLRCEAVLSVRLPLCTSAQQ